MLEILLPLDLAEEKFHKREVLSKETTPWLRVVFVVYADVYILVELYYVFRYIAVKRTINDAKQFTLVV